VRNTGKRYTDSFKKMIMEIYNSGKPIQEIFNEYGIASATLYKYLKNPPSNEPKNPIIKIDTCSNDVKKIKKY
jgi:transposase